MPITPATGDSSSSQIANQLNTLARDVQGLQQVQVFKDETGTRRVLLGKQGDGSYGLKVSKPTFDVYDATDSNLIFNSSQNVFKIVQSDTVSQTLTNTANVVSGAEANNPQIWPIPHNLGFSPAFLVYMTAPAGFVEGSALFQLPHTTFFNDGTVNDGFFFTHFHATADSTNLYIKYNHLVNTDYSPSSPTFTIRYYLLQETAN